MEKKIIESMSFIAFAKKHGPTLKIADFVSSYSGDAFKSLVFINTNDEKTLVGFSSKLGELTPKELIAQATTLQVVTLEGGHHYLCKQGGTWETVDLSGLLG